MGESEVFESLATSDKIALMERCHPKCKCGMTPFLLVSLTSSLQQLQDSAIQNLIIGEVIPIKWNGDIRRYALFKVWLLI